MSKVSEYGLSLIQSATGDRRPRDVLSSYPHTHALMNYIGMLEDCLDKGFSMEEAYLDMMDEGEDDV